MPPPKLTLRRRKRVRSYAQWLMVVAAAIGIPYLGEKWANQESPKNIREWVVVAAVVVILPLLSLMEHRVKSWFFKRFSPVEASREALKDLRYLIGVDFLDFDRKVQQETDKQPEIIKKKAEELVADQLFGPVAGNEDFWKKLEEHKKEIHEQSCLEPLEEGLRTRHFSPAYGTLGLIKLLNEEKSKEDFYFRSVYLVVTENIPEDFKNRYREYTGKLLQHIGVVKESTDVNYDIYDQRKSDFTNLQALKDYYENAADKALKEERTQSKNPTDTAFCIGIDITAGTVLHSLAAAQIADRFEALLLYNGTRQLPTATSEDRLVVVTV